MASKEALVMLEEPSWNKTIIAGKIVWHPVEKQWVFRWDTAGGKTLQIWDAVGIAPAIVSMLERREVEAVHVKIKGEKYVLTIPVSEIRRVAVLRSFGTRPAYYHIQRKSFTPIAECDLPFVNNPVVLVRWENATPEKPEPKPAQAALW